MSEVIIIPMGIHRYVCVSEEWEELVECVVDIMKRTSNIVNVAGYKWDMDLRMDSKVVPMNPNNFHGNLKDKIKAMTRLMLSALMEKYKPELSVVIEVRYHQEDFLSELNVYERWQKSVQAQACGAETEEEEALLAQALIKNEEVMELHQDMMSMVRLYKDVENFSG